MASTEQRLSALEAIFNSQTPQRFWQGMSKATALGLLDKIMVGMNTDGSAKYADINQIVNLASIIGGAGFKTNVTPSSSPVVSATPVYYIGTPGTYPNFGGVTITGAAGIIGQVGTDFTVTNINVDLSDYATKEEADIKIALTKGIDLFTLDGYIDGGSGHYVEQTGSSNRCTDFIPFTQDNTLTCTNLSNTSTIKQVAFYSNSNEASFISSYNSAVGDSVQDLSLSSAHTPVNTKYIRLSGPESLEKILIYDAIKPNNVLDMEVSSSITDRSVTNNLISGVNLFTNEGYIHKDTGAFTPQTSSNNRATDFIELTPEQSIFATNLTASGPIRQASFYADKRVEKFISSYTADNNSTISLNASNIPIGTKYVRLNGINTLAQSLSYNGIASNKYLQEVVIVDQINIDKIKNVDDLFSFVGYIDKNTGSLDNNPICKCTGYIKIDRTKTLFAKNLAVSGGSAFKQVAFFEGKNSASFISAYTGADLSDIELHDSDIPANANYMRFTAFAADNAILSYDFQKYRAVPPLKCVSGAWSSIDPVTGYSLNYGRYWDGNNWFANQYFSGLVYNVTPGKTIKIRGNFYGNNMPVVVFFSDAELTTHVANGSMKGGATPKSYFFKETVPSGASYALVQQFRAMGTNQPFTEMVVASPTEDIKKKVILIGNSYTGMAGLAEELMTFVKQIAPEYDIYNYGIGGEKTNEILARLGASQMFVEPKEEYLSFDGTTGQKYFMLPASTATVEIGSDSISNSWNDDKLALLKQTTPTTDCAPDNVFIDGIECVLTRTDGPNGPDGQPTNIYHLNRVTAGSAAHKVFTGTPLIPKSSIIINEHDIVIINIDANGGWTDVDDLVAQNKRLIDSIGTKRYIVLNSHYAQISDPSLPSSVANRVLQETALRKEFGPKYINTREYFITNAVNDALDSGYWNTGNYPTDIPGEVHPNSTDIIMMNNGEFATMFRCNPNNTGDWIHLARRTYVIYYKLIFSVIKALGYLNKG